MVAFLFERIVWSVWSVWRMINVVGAGYFKVITVFSIKLYYFPMIN